MVIFILISSSLVTGAPGPQRTTLGRRPLCQAAFPALAAALCAGSSASAAEDVLHNRDRGTNSNALVLKDFYYENGLVPPRRLRLDALPADQPKFNVYGSCVENSCTYVPLQRRYEGHKKYAADVRYGSTLFAGLKEKITSGDWTTVSAAVARGEASTKRPMGPVTVALLRAVLLGNALLISENNANELSDALLARFYLNEAAFAADEIRVAAEKADGDRALAAWELGIDSWASYFTVINRAIVPKVGDRFFLPS